jgi:hypothetical protein
MIQMFEISFRWINFCWSVMFALFWLGITISFRDRDVDFLLTFIATILSLFFFCLYLTSFDLLQCQYFPIGQMLALRLLLHWVIDSVCLDPSRCVLIVGVVDLADVGTLMGYSFLVRHFLLLLGCHRRLLDVQKVGYWFRGKSAMLWRSVHYIY